MILFLCCLICWLLLGYLAAVVKGWRWGWNDPRHGLSGWALREKLLFIFVTLLLWPIWLGEK